MVTTQNAPLQVTLDTYAQQIDALSARLLNHAHAARDGADMDMWEMWKADSEDAAVVAQLLRIGDWQAACHTVSRLDTAARELYNWYYEDLCA